MKNIDLKRIILKECSNGQFYGYEINKKLAAKGIRIEIGHLYIILNQMEKEKLITSHWEKSSKGPQKKYYKIAENGEKSLNEDTLKAIQTIHEAYGTYLMAIRPQKSVFHKIAQLVSGKNSKKGNITYFTDDFSPMNERLLSALQDLRPESTNYVVRPKEKQSNPREEKTVYLQGEYDNLPLKNEFSNLLIVNGFPKKDKMLSSIQEWARILCENGRIGIIVPSIILHTPKDPMSMTDFIEQLEHKTSEKYDFRWIIENMSNYFGDVEENEILHITVIVGIKSAKKT